MKKATIIRKAAKKLYIQAGSLRFEGDILDKDYILLLRKKSMNSDFYLLTGLLSLMCGIILNTTGDCSTRQE